MLTTYLEKLRIKNHLTADEAAGAMTAIMSGTADPEQIEHYLTLLAEKGETADEIAGSAIVMREHATCIHPNVPLLVDVCGTGGDGTNTFNVSTTVAFVVAGAGVAVAKHGNRAVSSASGSANVLEALGIRVELSPKEVENEIEAVGIGFMFAPLFHPAMKYVAPIRQKMKRRTIFNILGPLTNPAGATRQIVGVFQPTLTRLIADTLERMGHEHALVVHGAGLDEITTTGETTVAELHNDIVTEYTLTPAILGLPQTTLDTLKGGDATVNAEITRAVLNGEKGPRRDIVLANAGAALYVAGRVDSISGGIALAAETIDGGAAKDKLAAMAAWSHAPVM